MQTSPRVIVLVGLPGSGKTTRSKQLASEHDAEEIDDYRAGGGERLEDSLHYSRLAEALAAGRAVIVTDIEFCDARVLIDFVDLVVKTAPDAESDTQFYRRDVPQCWNNLQSRDATTARGSLARDRYELTRLAQVYSPPEDMPLLEVWRPPNGGPPLGATPSDP